MEPHAGTRCRSLGSLVLLGTLVFVARAGALEAEPQAASDTTASLFTRPATDSTDSLLAVIERLEYARTASVAELEPLLGHPAAEVRARAALALGRVAPAGAAVPLGMTLGDSEPTVRWLGAFAIGQTGDPEGLAPLITTTSDPEPKVAAQAADALSRIGGPEAGATLAHLLTSPEARVRRSAALGLSRLADSTHAGSLVSALKTEADPQAAAGMLEALEKMPRQAPAALVVAQLESPSPLVRAPAARTLGKIGDPGAATTPLITALADREWRVRVTAARALGELRARSAVEPLVKRLTDPVHHVRESAAVALGEIGDETAVEPLVRASTDPSPGVRRAAVTAIGAILGSRARATLITRMEDSAPQVSAAALTALGTATGADAIPRAIERTDPGQPSLGRLAAVDVLAAAALPETRAVLRALVSDEDWVIAASAAEALAANGDREAEDALLERAALSAGFEATEARLAAIAALGRMGTERTSGMLARALSDPDPRVRLAAIDCVDSLAVRGVRLDPSLRSAVNAEEKRLRTGGDHPPAFLGPTPDEFPPIPPPREHEARIITPRGAITVTLFTDIAPIAVANFVRLARNGFYDDGVFHRVVPNFVIQGGCPRHDGYGGPGYALPAEVSPEEYGVGTLGMADAGLDTAGSQFFLTHSPVPRLEGRYTAFGRVTAGLAVLDEIQIGDWFRVEIVSSADEGPDREGASERESDAK